MKKNLPLKQVSLIFVLAVIGMASTGQSIFTNLITGTNPNASNPYTLGQSIDVNLAVSGIGRGAGISGSNANDRYSANGWNSVALDATDYFEFTITPNSGAKINFVSFVYTGQSSGSGPATFAFRSSIDGYTADIGSPNATGTTILLSAAAFQSITSAVTFRIYGWGASSGVGTFSINDFTFNGNVLPVTSQYYRSRNSGDWNAVGTWQFSQDNITWSNSTLIPTSLEKSITIQSGHIVTTSASVSLDETVIQGTFQLLQGGILNINDGTGNDINIQNNGILQVLSTDVYSNTIKPATAAINISTGGKIEIGDGTIAVGTGYEGFATSSSNLWNNNSTFEWNNTNAFAMNAGIIYFPNAAPGTVPNFVITKTTAGAIAGTTATIKGLLTVNTNFALSPTSGTVTFRDGISGNSQLTLNNTGGSYTIGSTSATPNAIFGGTVTIVLNKSIALNTGINIPSGASVTITGSSTNGINKGTNGIFQIDGTIDMTTTNLSNTSGSVIVNGTLKTSSVSGLYGSGAATITSGTINLNSNSTIEYNAISDQSITPSSTMGGVTYYNITFSGTGIKTPFPASSVNVNTNGTVKITGTTIVNALANNIGPTTTGNTTAFIMDGGIFELGTVATLPLMEGNYNLTGGVVEYKAAGQTVRGGKTYYAIEVSNGSNVLAGAGDIALGTNGSFTVKNGGIFTITNNKSINATPSDGTQTITLENRSTFDCGSNQGFNGFTEAFGAWSSIDASVIHFNLDPGSTVEYMYAGNQPITNADGLVYGNLSISGSGTKTAPTGVLTIKGNLAKSGTSTFMHNNGTVLFNGTGIQTFAGLTFYEVQLANNVKQTSGSSTIIDSIKINDGSGLSISNGDIVTLHSDATKTARLGQMGTGTINYNVSGKFVIERYISGHRAWRFLSVPVTSQTIQSAWQENGTTGGTVAGLGTQITGPQGTTAGFDLYSGKPSLKTFNSSTNDYDAVTATTIPFDVSKGGYMLFVRGDRNTTYPATSSTTLRTSGLLYTGNQGSVSVSNQFTPVNNPYASQIDMVKLSPDGITYPAFYVWDPNLGGTYGYGAFVTFLWNPGTSHFDITNSGGSYADGDHIIDNGQAFLVSTLGTGFSIAVTENVKTDVPLMGGLTPFTPVVRSGQQLRTLLYTTDNDGNYYMTDGVLNNYGDNFSNNIDGMDARKYLNSSENLSIARGSVLLGIERRQTLHMQDTIFFQVSNLKATGTYRFVFVPANIDESGLQPYLEDGYFHSRIPLRLNDSTQVNFVNDGAAGSMAPDRFRIVFQAAQSSLPLTITNVKAYTKKEGIAVEWNVDNETGMKSYQVEKSADGTTGFVPSSVIKANNNRRPNNYSWLDGQPLAGYNHYRVKSMNINGQMQYSKVVKVWEGDSKSGISVYPNPSSNGIIHLLFNNQVAGKYAIRLINKWGQVVYSKQIQHANIARSSEDIAIDQYTAHGVYRLEVMKPGVGPENINVVY